MQDVLRRELKYKLSAQTASLIQKELSCILSEDPHNKHGGYMVRSLYFDTPCSNDYFDKISGVDYRKKIRMRIYSLDDIEVKLELKEKQNVFQRKRSLLIDREQALATIHGNLSGLRDMGEFGTYMYTLMSTDCYRPVCMVQYQRNAYINETNDTRITFDTYLMSNEGNFNLFDRNLQLYPVWLLGNTLMEVKYNHFLLSHIKNVIDRADKLSVSSSKYCQCRMYGLGGE